MNAVPWLLIAAGIVLVLLPDRYDPAILLRKWNETCLSG